MDAPKIPFGYKQVWGQLQKGDGVWSPEHGKFVKTKKVPTPVTVTKMRYPIVMQAATVAIRKCEVVQAELPGTHESTPADIMAAHQFLYYVKCAPIISDREYDEFCKANGLSGIGGSDRAQDYSEAIRALAVKLTDPLGAQEPLNLDE